MAWAELNGFADEPALARCEIDDEALARAAKELGTTSKKDTVNAALTFVAERRRRIDALLDHPHALGTGPDITDPGVMDGARR